ncbi:MAG: DUF3883 domain-containing protein [Candidatus Nitrohelix vancouverensis]|uniref:DUF3883 domain-containing protein n=1 Tax=Candidatus Nitrohelix vancouverensis TaxID=2705534 RepID=A0A7T0C1I7_9BACT|nr:MAG: DUF3883 domain-containing protein [Candidatus Nitrohelix vancouverensis]
MNRLEIETRIRERVPILSNSNEWKKTEKLRKEFVRDYPIKKLMSLQLDQYVIGMGKENRSFCYRLERQLDSLGRILGATAGKFGIYFGRTKADSQQKYRFAKRWGSNEHDVFEAVKSEIINLLESAERDDFEMIRANQISPNFKGKLLFIYYPEKFAPIYSKDHLQHFLAHLNISGKFESPPEMQRALMDYRKTWPKLLAEHPCLFMRFLYDEFNPEIEGSTLDSDSPKTLPILDKALQGSEFIDEFPEGKNSSKEMAKKPPRDYEKHLSNLKSIGTPGEKIVLELEKKRLSAGGRKDLVKKIIYTADIDDRAGYDILSYETDGAKRYIEVKATTGKNLGRGFYISANEFEKSKSLGNYYIYFVFSTITSKPKVFCLKNPTLDKGNFKMEAINYHVTFNTGN